MLYNFRTLKLDIVIEHFLRLEFFNYIIFSFFSSLQTLPYNFLYSFKFMISFFKSTIKWYIKIAWYIKIVVAYEIVQSILMFLICMLSGLAIWHLTANWCALLWGRPHFLLSFSSVDYSSSCRDKVSWDFVHLVWQIFLCNSDSSHIWLMMIIYGYFFWYY